MKILFAAIPTAGHVNPLLTIARMAKARGNDTLFTTGRHFASAASTADADLDFREIEQLFPEFATLPPGPAKLRFQFERVFLDLMEPQAATLRTIIADEAPDVIVTEGQFLGRAPLILDRAHPRPPIVNCEITFLALDRPDGAPTGLGLPPARDEAERAQYAAIAAEFDTVFTRPVQAYANAKLAAMGLPGLPYSVLQSCVLLADAYLQPTVPAFEYDFGPLPPNVRFVGALPPLLSSAPLPDWWSDLDGSRRIVLVTQGTVANFDFSQLVEPTLMALAGRDDLLVVVTTGGRPIENVRGPIPANARLAPFLDYKALLPKIDLLVTNGGYGTVSLALQTGVPIVAAGRTEDKAEIGARVAWSGVGIEIASNTPDVDTLRDGIMRAIENSSFKERAQVLAGDFAALDTEREIFNVIDGLGEHCQLNFGVEKLY